MNPGRIVSFIFGFAILAYLFNKIGFGKIREAARSLDPYAMLGFFLVLSICIILKGVKWKMSLDVFGIKAGAISAIEMWVIGFFAGAATPARMGDFIKIMYLDEKRTKSLGAVFFDRLTDIFAVVLFAILGLNIFGSALGATQSAILFTAALVLFSAIIAKKYRKQIMRALFQRMVPERYRDYLKEGAMDFLDSFRSAFKQRQRVAQVALMSIFIWLFSILPSYIIATSLGIKISYFYLIVIMSVVALVELIPVTVAGLGTREATLVVLMSFLGIESEKAVVFSLINFVFGYLSIVLAGYLLWLKNPAQFASGKHI